MSSLVSSSEPHERSPNTGRFNTLVDDETGGIELSEQPSHTIQITPPVGLQPASSSTLSSSLPPSSFGGFAVGSQGSLHPIQPDTRPGASSIDGLPVGSVPSSFSERGFAILQAKVRRMEAALRIADERFNNLKREHEEKTRRMTVERERRATGTSAREIIQGRKAALSVAAALNICEIKGCRRNADGVARCEYPRCGIRLCYIHHTMAGEEAKSDDIILCPDHRQSPGCTNNQACTLM